MEKRMVTTHRDCPAQLVPTGDPLTIPAGTFVTLTQALGSSFTVVVNGNMARISGKDADAIGLIVETLDYPPSTVGTDEIDPSHIRFALQSVFDPEIPVNIADLGLIYNVAIDHGTVTIQMTLTAPGCGMGPVLVEEVKERVETVPNVTDVMVELVFDPPWSRDMMTEEAQLELGVF
ncbi:MAG: putative Fe-S cluster assembly protein SufT [Pseudomonadota bacterium]